MLDPISSHATAPGSALFGEPTVEIDAWARLESKSASTESDLKRRASSRQRVATSAALVEAVLHAVQVVVSDTMAG